MMRSWVLCQMFELKGMTNKQVLQKYHNGISIMHKSKRWENNSIKQMQPDADVFS